MDHPSPLHIAHLLLKGLSIGTVSALTHPIAYPISAAALLCQANVVQTSDVHKIILYAFSKARFIKLFKGGGRATIIKTFISVASVAIEEIWLAVSPLQLSKSKALLISKIAGLVFSVAINNPLDVIRTRLALEEFGRPNHIQSTLSSEYNKIVNEEGFPALYSGWQVVVLQFISDYWIQKWDTKSQRQKGSVFQLFPMLIKFITDYAFTVIKIRANMRNSGILTIMKNVVSQNGLRGFMAGWKIHLLLFPLVMVNMILANVVFLQLKKLLFPSQAPPHPKPGPGGMGMGPGGMGPGGMGMGPGGMMGGRGGGMGGMRRSGEGSRSFTRTSSITSIDSANGSRPPSRATNVSSEFSNRATNGSSSGSSNETSSGSSNVTSNGMSNGMSNGTSNESVSGSSNETSSGSSNETSSGSSNGISNGGSSETSRGTQNEPAHAGPQITSADTTSEPLPPVPPASTTPSETLSEASSEIANDGPRITSIDTAGESSPPTSPAETSSANTTSHISPSAGYHDTSDNSSSTGQV